LQAIGLVFLVLGGTLALTALPSRVKIAILSTPFVMLLLDFGSRFVARWAPSAVYLMLLTGAAIGLSMASMILLPLWEMWLKKAPPEE
jgi:hypothetical protein